MSPDKGGTEHLRPMLLSLGLTEPDADVLLAWSSASNTAAIAAARAAGTQPRSLPRAVLAEVRCPARKHLLATIYRVAEGPLLWPATRTPPAKGHVRWDQRDPPPRVDGHGAVDREGMPKDLSVDPRALLLTVPASMRAAFPATMRDWVDAVRLWCRCGAHVIDAHELSERFRERGVAPPTGKAPVILADPQAGA